MGLFDMFVNQQKKTEEIMSKDLEKYVTASMQPIDSDLLEIKEKLDTYKGIIVFPEALWGISSKHFFFSYSSSILSTIKFSITFFIKVDLPVLTAPTTPK